MLYGKLRKDVREIISTLCRYKDVEIIDGAVVMTPYIWVWQYRKKSAYQASWDNLKGKSMLMVHDRHPKLQSKWDKSFWARGYYQI